MADKKQPQNLEAERALLGSILLDNSAFGTALVKPEHFFSAGNGLIYSEIERQCSANRKVDPVTLAEELGKSGALDKAGGVAYIASLSDGVPVGDHTLVSNYAGIIRQKYILRKLVAAGSSLMSKALEAAAEPDVLAEQIISEVTSVVDGSSERLVDDKTAALNLLATLEKGWPSHVMTGIRALDDITGGFLGGELILITAGTGVGKTVVTRQIKRAACVSGRHGLYCSGEMSGEHLVGREMFAEAGVSHWKVRQPEEIERDEFERLVRTVPNRCPVCQTQYGDLSLAEIRWGANRIAGLGQLGLLCVDYDELVEAPGATENDQQKNLVIGLKALAIHHDIPVILVSQLNKPKDDDNRPPTLRRIYGSGFKSKTASIVLYIDRQYVEKLEGDQTEAKVYVLKSRDGEVGKVPLTFNVRTLTFENAGEQGLGDRGHGSSEEQPAWDDAE